MITTLRALRKAFWVDHPNLSRKKIPNHSGNGKMYTVDVRCAWANWLDMMKKDKQISREFADRATL